MSATVKAQGRSELYTPPDAQVGWRLSLWVMYYSCYPARTPSRLEGSFSCSRKRSSHYGEKVCPSWKNCKPRYRLPRQIWCTPFNRNWADSKIQELLRKPSNIVTDQPIVSRRHSRLSVENSELPLYCSEVIDSRGIHATAVPADSSMQLSGIHASIVLPLEACKYSMSRALMLK